MKAPRLGKSPFSEPGSRPQVYFFNKYLNKPPCTSMPAYCNTLPYEQKPEGTFWLQKQAADDERRIDRDDFQAAQQLAN